ALDYTHDLNEDMYLISQINGYYQSDSLNNLGNTGRHAADIDGFSLWNFSSRLSTDTWDVTFFVKNLFNEAGVTGKYTEAYGGTDPSENFLGNSAKNYISLPRTVGVSATYRFE
ncbi:MAG: iron complex outermembrane receptor protein, partial [Enterobacterales bacterium]